MDRSTVVVVPAAVPQATVVRVPASPAPAPVAIPVQPAPVPAASVLALELARADAETARRLQARVEALRTRLDLRP